MSSAMRKASKKLVPCSTQSISRSLGITITVSTQPINSASACSACSMRRLPSNANGLVTTATVSAPSSLARFATTGAAPLPVPPPRPAVTNTMSAPSSASRIFSVSSSAALRPTSGFAPAPSPFVSFAPNCSFTGACDNFSACKSVLAAMNSTPSTFARIMRLTALEPPPPTPITFIFAPLLASSKNDTRIADSFCAMLPPQSFPNFVFCIGYLLRPCKHAFQLAHPAAGTRSAGTPGARAVQNQSHRRGILGPGNLFAHSGESARRCNAHRKIENPLGQLAQAAQLRAAAGEHDARGNHAFSAAAAQFVADQHQQFMRARLDDF